MRISKINEKGGICTDGGPCFSPKFLSHILLHFFFVNLVYSKNIFAHGYPVYNLRNHLNIYARMRIHILGYI
jgi:hypothetical protein